jgi:gamma-glutamyltranspeptidase/glutathione hydrolase
MDATNRARVETALAQALKSPPASPRDFEILDPQLIARYAAEVFGTSPAIRGTTHISVIDRAGNVAAMSLSNGEGNGYIIPGSGIVMNNMMGEADILPEGFDSWTPDRRLSSMMSPTIAHFDDGGLAALGSGGSNRIRSAILQVLLNLADHGMEIDEAVKAPRMHVEQGTANIEVGYEEAALAELAEIFHDTLPWPRNNLFFGGVHAVSRGPLGDLAAAGDPRRGGVAVLV